MADPKADETRANAAATWESFILMLVAGMIKWNVGTSERRFEAMAVRVYMFLSQGYYPQIFITTTGLILPFASER